VRPAIATSKEIRSPARFTIFELIDNMARPDKRYIPFLICTLCILLFASCFKSLTTSSVVFENDFENQDLKGIVTAPGRISYYNGSLVMGKFNNSAFEVSLWGLPSHTILRVEMDLFIHNNWNNELWRMALDGNNYLITGFSNKPNGLQSYPTWLNTTMSPAGANAQSTSLPGICTQAGTEATSLYHIVQTISHTASDFVLICGDASNPPYDTCYRAWSVDNLKVTVLHN
jgi:hypothetical protein